MKILLSVLALGLAFGAVSSLWAEDATKVQKVAIEKIEISYCASWGYKSKAAGLAATLKALTGIDPVLQVGATGSFEVVVNDTLVFSKTKTNRFPEEGEVVEFVKENFIIQESEKPAKQE